MALDVVFRTTSTNRLWNLRSWYQMGFIYPGLRLFPPKRIELIKSFNNTFSTPTPTIKNLTFNHPQWFRQSTK